MAKINSPAWQKLIGLCGKTQKGSISRFYGRLSDRGIDPPMVSDAAILREFKIARIEGRADTRGQINSFVRNFNEVSAQNDLGLPVLKSYPGPRTIRKADWLALPDPLKSGVEAFLAERARKPSKKSSRHKDGVVALIEPDTVVHEKNAIRRCIGVLAGANMAPKQLADLITSEAVKKIARSFGAEKEISRSRIVALSVLRMIAAHLGDARASEYIRRIIKVCKKPEPEISNAALERLAPYFDAGYRGAFLRKVEGAAVLPIIITRGALFRAEGAIAILVIVKSLSPPRFVSELKFSGKSRQVGAIERPLLAHADFKVENFEKAFQADDEEYGADLSEIIDAHHNRLKGQLGCAPPSPFIDMDGDIRKQHAIFQSVRKLFEELEVGLRPMDLRDLGVAIKIMRKKRHTTQIAALARYDHQNFLERFQKLIDVIDDYQE